MKTLLFSTLVSILLSNIAYASTTIEVGNFIVQSPTNDWEIFESSKNHIYMTRRNNLSIVVSISALKENSFQNTKGDYPSIFIPATIKNSNIEVENGNYSTKTYNGMKCLSFHEDFKVDKNINRKQEGYICSHSNNKDSIAFKYLSIIRGAETEQDAAEFSNAWGILNNLNVHEK